MTQPPAEAIDYVVARIEEALISDDRLSEQGLEVSAVGDRIVVRGQIATEERRRVATEIAADLAGRHELLVDITVQEGRSTDAPEAL